MSRRHLRLPSPAALAGLVAAPLLAATLSSAQAQPAGGARSGQCFSSKDWSGWKASADSRTLYIRVEPGGVYRLDLSYACPDLHNIDAKLINRAHEGDSNVCSPLDLDLTVITPPAEVSPCMVKTITRLSRDQAAALPKEMRP
jgi:hypothetical protein